MAEKKTTQVTEPAQPDAQVAQVTEPAIPAKIGRRYDPRKRVYVYDTVTKEKLTRPVPETHLDGRFPNLKQVPSDARKGK